MKKIIAGGLMFGAFMLVSTGSPLQLLSIDSVQPACALEMGRDPAPDGRHRDGDHRDRKHPRGPGHRVAEPTTLALLAAGGVGIGIFGFLRRRNRK